MYYYLLHNISNNKRPFFVNTASIFNDDEECYIDFDMLGNIEPRTFNDRIDMIMLNLNKFIKSVGDELEFPCIEETLPNDGLPLLYNVLLLDCTYSSDDWKTENQAEEIMNILKEYDYIKHAQVLGDDQNAYTFTANGWNHISNLLQKNDELPQAFIAMWFSVNMDAVRTCIGQAIIESGYLPIIIDEKEHNNQIVPEILFEVKRSKFMVADLTGHRNGVYYEAGYAQALGKEVILTCREDDFSERHFDIAQQNIICWNDTDDLHNRLLKRIEATVGKRCDSLSQGGRLINKKDNKDWITEFIGSD